MKLRSARFLRAALGSAGAHSLAVAAEGSLASAALPRVALAWFSAASAHGWSGRIPGLSGTRLELAKGESGGSLVLGRRTYRFGTLEGGAAVVALAAGYDPRVKLECSSAALARLGRGVESVARARFEAALEKAEKIGRVLPAGLVYACDHRHNDRGTDAGICQRPAKYSVLSGGIRKRFCDQHTPDKTDDSGVKKAEAAAPDQGRAAAPKDPGQPTAPAAPTSGVKPPKPGTATGTTTGTQVKPARRTVLRLTKSAAGRPCDLCGRPQFVGDRFTGCDHFSELAKSAFSAKTLTGYVVELKASAWDPEAVAELVRAFREEE